MSEKEKKVMETLKEAVPHLSESQRSYLLGYGDAVLEMNKEKKKEGESKDE